MEYFIEPFEGEPQSYFLIKDQMGIQWIGKKTKTQRKYLGSFTPFISSSMILGKFLDFRIDQDAYYFAIDSKCQKFKDLKFIEIVYPFAKLIGERKLEIRSNPKGWTPHPKLNQALDLGEKPIRSWSISRLLSLGLQNKIIYDPACSTGRFLHEVKQACVSSFTIGQELNSEMLSIAQNRVDKSILGSAIHSPIPNSSVDYLICRFLNSGVVTTRYAHGAFARLSLTLKKDGYALLFGYTPVLISSLFLNKLGFEIIESVGNIKNDIYFQHYIAKKTTSKLPRIKGLTA
jgi:ubiquinone/menaquinone biosynthesis C-methylase UbiE